MKDAVRPVKVQLVWQALDAQAATGARQDRQAETVVPAAGGDYLEALRDGKTKASTVIGKDRDIGARQPH